jgi:Tol biopolymer transport system component
MESLMRIPICTIALCVGTVIACDRATPLPVETKQVPRSISADAFADAEWSAPVHLPAPINSASSDLGPDLSPDELSLYFGSNRPGGSGDVDLWAVHRDCLDCPWGTPFNLNINSLQSDGDPSFSPDGHVLFFTSNRAGGHGGDDIWLSYREDVADDLGWGPPVNLGPGVNTADHETGPVYVPALRPEGANLYFIRGGVPGGDIYRALITLDGATLGDATPVVELNSPAFEMDPAVRHDGKEIFFASARGSSADADIWVATRQNVTDPWSEPVNVGPTINTPGGELTPGLSHDGRTLLWSATMTARPGVGRQDIWMSTRHQGNPR